MRYSLNNDISLNTVTTGTTVVSDGKVTGLNNNLTDTEDKTDPVTNNPIPVKKAELSNTLTAVNKKNAATVGDVLNSGWNLQNNGTAKDFVRPYDTVNFVDGINTKAVVTTDEEGKVSNVTYNVVGLPIKYTDNAGNPVKKVGDKYYKTDEAGNVLDNAGNPVTKYDTAGNPLNADDTAVNPVNDVKTNLVNAKPGTGKTGTTDPTTLGNVKSELDKITGAGNKAAGLVNLNTPNVSDSNVVTVGDLKNMGWVVSAEGNSYNAQVKNANEVNFVGKNGLTVTGKTEANGVRTITIENSHSPITYTDENGNKLRKVGDNFYPENAVVNNGNVYPEGSVVIDGEVYPEGTTKAANGDKVKKDGNPAVVATPIANTPSEKVKATLNSVTPNKPTTLSNVGSNLKQVVDPNGTNPGSVKNPDGSDVSENGAPVTVTNKAPYTASEAADIANKLGNNAATVADVLNAGWNLQGNGKAVDFVKPYDTVNFRDGGNTTITYETNGTTSHMQVNVTGLPVTNTITDPTSGKQVPLVKVGDTYYPAKTDGTPNIKKDEHGNPTNGYTIADDGNIYNSGDITFGPEQANGTKTKTNNPDAKPVTINSNMSNPNVTTDSKNAVNTPTQLGNVANGAKTHNPIGADGTELKQANDGNYYPATKVNPDGSLAIDAGNGMTYPPVKPIEMGNDGKWYEKDKLDSNGNPKQGATEVPNPLKNVNKAGLVDFTNSNSNNVATVGDLRNMGWVVSSNKTTDDLETAYNDQVRNANEVKFVGTGMATVSGKTVDGVRTITVDVNAQKTVEEAQVPVVYTDKDGNKLTKIGDKFYNKAAVPTGVVSHNGNLYPAGSVVIGNKVYPVGSRVNGAGNVVDGAGNPATEENPIEDVHKNEVKASMNSGDNTTTPTTLSNVKGNLPQVNDKDKTVFNPKTGTTKPADNKNTTKAPITADEASDIMKPTIVNEAGETVANPNYAGNNAATVGDVLNAGWNLQGNGKAVDFVKPYDTVNFVDGVGTTVEASVDEKGTTSTIKINTVMQYTDKDGNPVKKAENGKYYKESELVGKVFDTATNTFKNANGTPLATQPKEVKNPQVNIVNAEPDTANNKTATTTPTQLGNVANGSKTYAAPQVNGKDVVQAKDGKWYNATDVVNGTPNKNVTPVTAPVNPGKSGLVDFSNSNPTNVATVGDLRNMGWVVSSDNTTGNLGTAYNDQVKNANEVKFVGTGTATVSGKTDDKGVRTITVDVNAQVSTNNSVTPVVYTKADGTKVYPKEVDNGDGTKTIKFYPNPDGTGTEIPKEEVITSVNGPKGTTTPSILSNVAGNLDGAKTGTQAPTTNAALPNTTDKTGNKYINPNNAATVGDVLNAGWNLQGNGTAVDFVKPYDTVNFIDGGNTKAVVTTAEDGKSSTVTYNVTGLPITYTDKDGKPVAKVGDKFYPVDENGNPVITKDTSGNPTNAVDPSTLKTNMVNPTAKPNEIGKPTKLSNVAPAEISKTSTDAVNGSQLNNTKDNNPFEYADKDGNPVVKANDGKFYDPKVVNSDGTPKETQVVGNDTYLKEDLDENGAPKAGATPLKVKDPLTTDKVDVHSKETKPITNVVSGLDNFKDKTGAEKPLNDLRNLNETITKPDGTKVPKVSDNTAATVGDLRNLGWIVSSDKTTGSLGDPYADSVKHANEVKFVGTGTAIVSGKTDANGVRTIKIEVNDQLSTNNSVTPVVYTKADGTKVYPIKQADGTTKFNTNPDGTGEDVDKGDVITSVNGPKGTTTPTTLSNVEGNLDGAKTGTTAPTTNAALPNITDKTGNNYINPNNAATVGDVLNAGWNLQNNGTEKDFVKPYDTVNFVNGGNTVAEVITDADGKVSNVTYNVTGLPVTYTNEAGKPVSKVGDNYYVVNDKGQPVSEQGLPAVGKNAAGKLVDKDGNVIEPIDTTAKPLSTNLVNPNVATDKQTTTPTQLGNVANGAKTFEPVAADGTKLVQVGDKFYPADKVENGVLKPGTTPADAKDPVKLANDGKWYSADKVGKNGEPEAGATPVTPVNPGKAGLVDFNNSNPTNAATVGDLQNMGWVVGTPDNGYNDQVRNANKVDFKGGNGIVVTGKTTADGTREITVGIKEGEVTNEVTVVRKDENGNVLKNPDGTDMKPIEAIRDKDGKLYAKDKNGKADKTKEITLGEHDTVTNNGSGFVTGNTVATAIQESGWNVGKADAKDVTKAFEKEAKLHDKVNPNDNVKFVDGDNTTVSMVTIDSKDEAGTKVATTYIKTDINRDIHIDSVTTVGKITNNAGDTMMLGNDGKYYPAGSVVSKTGNVYPAGTTLDKDGNPTTPVSPITTPLTPTEVTDVKVESKTELTKDGIKMTPARPMKDKVDLNKVVNLTNGGLNNGGNNITNVEGNLDGAKTGTTAPTTKHVGVDTTTSTAANYVNPHNAATVGDVLNAGWNLQNNGQAKDFVKPYDTVNFINGGNTTAVVTTDANGTTSNVTYNVTGLPISYTDKDGKPVSKVGDNYYVVNDKGQPLQDDGTPVTKYDTNGNPLNNNGSPVTKVDTSKNPLTINLVNPNVSADKATKTPMKIGNIESGAKTFDAPKDKNGNPLTKANDGKWYLSNEVDPNGTVKKGAKVKDPVIGNVTENNDPRKAGLINFGHSNSDTTNAATVGDLQNMGWVVSTSDTGYNDQVRNTNVVDFKEGEGIKISGETLENGVRQIKVGIDKNVVATKQELAQVERLSSAGIAGVAAMANIPQINEAASNRYNIAVGVGYHKGEKALAVGISGVSDGGRVVYKASAALDSQKQTTVGLGVGYQFGKRDIEPNELDRFRAQLDLVNTQKSSLAQKLKEETHKVKELNNKVEELEKQNKMLNEKMDLILKKLGGK